MLKKRVVPLVFLGLSLGLAYAELPSLEVIPVVHRPAAEILPLLEPLLDENDRAIADGSNLLIRTTPDKFKEIRALLNKLDLPVANLLITVLQSRQATAEELNAQAWARLNVRANDPAKSNAMVSGYYYQTQEQGGNDSTQTIRTLEGNPAYIKTGNAYPIQNYQSYNYGYGYYGGSSSTEYIDVTTGFAVTPRLAGRQVILEVAPWSDNLDPRGQIQTQAAQSTLRVNLGEWVELGGIAESSQSSANRTLGRSWQTNDNRLHILIKVDKAE